MAVKAQLPSVRPPVAARIEAEIAGVEVTRRTIAERESAILAAAPDGWAALPTRGALAFDVTAVSEMKRILAAVDDVLAALPPDMRRFVELRYGPPAHPPAECAARLYVSEQTCYRWRRLVVGLVAAKLGWR